MRRGDLGDGLQGTADRRLEKAVGSQETADGGWLSAKEWEERE